MVSIELFEMVESRTLFNCLMWWSKKFYKINCSRIKDSIDLFNKWSHARTPLVFEKSLDRSLAKNFTW